MKTIIQSLFLFASITLFSHQAFSTELKGRVFQANGSLAVGAEISLYRIEMSNQPSLVLEQKQPSDSLGSFSFQIKPEKNSVLFYQIDAKFNNLSTGYGPLKIEKADPFKEIEIRFPVVSTDIGKLMIMRNVYLVEYLRDSIRISDIINVKNGGTTQVQGGITWRKNLPESAFAFQDLTNSPNVKITRTESSAAFDVSFAPGEYQIIYSYEVPSSWFGVDLNLNLFPKTEALELVSVKDELELEISNLSMAEIASSSRTVKKFSKTTYNTQLIQLKPGVTGITLSIKGIPLNQRLLLYPAVILFLFLLLGLWQYLRRLNKV